MENNEFDKTLSDVKNGLKELNFKRRDLILILGERIHRTTSDHESVCEQIKYYLREEILDGIISRRDIERYCPDNWKRKTKPKKEKENDNLPFSEDKKSQPPMIINIDGKVISDDQYYHVIGDKYTNSCAEYEEIGIDDIDSSDIKNLDQNRTSKDIHNYNNYVAIEIPFQYEEIQRYMTDEFAKHKGTDKIWIHAIIDTKKFKVISYRLGRNPE